MTQRLRGDGASTSVHRIGERVMCVRLQASRAGGRGGPLSHEKERADAVGGHCECLEGHQDALAHLTCPTTRCSNSVSVLE